MRDALEKSSPALPAAWIFHFHTTFLAWGMKLKTHTARSTKGSKDGTRRTGINIERLYSPDGDHQVLGGKYIISFHHIFWLESPLFTQTVKTQKTVQKLPVVDHLFDLILGIVESTWDTRHFCKKHFNAIPSS